MINREFIIRGMTEREIEDAKKKMNFLHKTIYNLSEYIVFIMILIFLRTRSVSVQYVGSTFILFYDAYTVNHTMVRTFTVPYIHPSLSLSNSINQTNLEAYHVIMRYTHCRIE